MLRRIKEDPKLHPALTSALAMQAVYLTVICRRRSEYCGIIPDKVEGIIPQYSLSLRRIIVLV